MIEHKTGDILSEDAEALVNTVNCVGIMGRGVALQFKNAFPENYEAYKDACDRGEVRPGRMFVFETAGLTNPRYIINFPTKRHWKAKSRIEDIESGLRALVEEVQERGIRSVAVPPLGSGLGGLSWNDVRPRIEEAFQAVDPVRVVIFEPKGAPEASKMATPRAAPKMTFGRAALIGLIRRYLAGLLDPFVTLLELHKLMYFMQESGQRLRLRYTKALYGPYAENLKHVLREIEGHFIVGYADGGDDPKKQLELIPGALEDAEAFLVSDPQARQRFQRVVDLVQGFETPFGLELLSTVHWIVTREGARTLDEVTRKTYAWNDRKRSFSKQQIELALDILARKGWIDSSTFATTQADEGGATA